MWRLMSHFSDQTTPMTKSRKRKKKLPKSCPFWLDFSVNLFIAYSRLQMRALWLGAVKQATKATLGVIVCFREVKDTEG